MVEQSPQNTASKSELLNKLKIDKALKQLPEGYSLGNLLMLCVSSLLLGSLLSYYFFAKDQSSRLASSNPVKSRLMTDDQQSNTTSSTSLPQSLVEARTSSSQTSHSQTSVSQTSRSQASGTEILLNASGYITARRMATVSSQVMGLIKRVNAEEGISVVKGQVLATLDDAIPKVSLQQAKAQLKSLSAQLESVKASMTEAALNYTRVKNNQYSSDAAKTLSLTNRKKANALVNQILAEINVATINVTRQQQLLEQYTIRAPFDGVVTMKNAQPGEIVSPGSAGGGFTRTGICTLVDMSSLEIEVDVNESYIGRVYPNQRVTASLDAYPDWSIPASVIAIIPTADRGKATVSVRIKIELRDKKILPDMGVKVAFLKAENEGSL
ncbi:MAG: efflux RND transporter periplasmic adaptor subunit [Enterobacterales bacterium]|nr:efflux RND transporter periplasmic adaptor subunit [Enterobacterales bacterium]